tara:strand:+ start:219 stop:419 length:201 start_codon:yes stop_codon:yes gene_type:complete
MENKPNECDMVVTLTIPYVPNCKESFLLNISNYLTDDCFRDGLVYIGDVEMVNETYVEARDEEINK